MTVLAGWQNFYVIVGSSAGALIGLQFVVLSLIVARATGELDASAGHAFSTPTIIHFGVVLALAAILSAPWDGAGPPTVLFGLVGLCGIAYNIVITQRVRKQTAYSPEFEDWLFYSLLPIAAHLTLVISALSARAYLRAALFAVSAAVLLLLFVGIHNAWDAITYHVFAKKSGEGHH